MIIKVSLRNQVKKYLQDQMLNGRISFGERLSLPTLAKELGVSVTPIREALTQLQQVHVVEAIPNKGFFLPHLDKAEAADIYPVIANLEHLAVSMSQYDPQDIEQLKRVQASIAKASSAKVIVSKDLKFHDLLLGKHRNAVLEQVLADLKIRVFLYEFHYMKNSELSKLSSSYHNRIIHALEHNDPLQAADLVKESWLTSIDFIKDQF